MDAVQTSLVTLIADWSYLAAVPPAAFKNPLSQTADEGEVLAAAAEARGLYAPYGTAAHDLGAGCRVLNEPRHHLLHMRDKLGNRDHPIVVCIAAIEGIDERGRENSHGRAHSVRERPVRGLLR